MMSRIPVRAVTAGSRESVIGRTDGMTTGKITCNGDRSLTRDCARSASLAAVRLARFRRGSAALGTLRASLPAT